MLCLDSLAGQEISPREMTWLGRSSDVTSSRLYGACAPAGMMLSPARPRARQRRVALTMPMGHARELLRQVPMGESRDPKAISAHVVSAIGSPSLRPGAES